MINFRIIERPAFEVIGKQTWIAGTDDSAAFGRFWELCGSDGTLSLLEGANGFQPGPQTAGRTLGLSRVEKDPANRAFYYMIAIEKPASCPPDLLEGMETYRVPTTQWAAFECHGKVPESIVQAEMYAFMEWLPNSGYEHALAPEMEVYPNQGDEFCEFWLPIQLKV